jgi:ABC-type glutathione transport system ATPase component
VNLFEVRGIDVSLQNSGHSILKNIQMEIEANCITALIGESGSGKTILSRTISGLLPENMMINSGLMLFKNRNISYSWLKKQRGKLVFYTPQNATASLNPVIKIKNQLKEVCNNDSKRIIDILNSLQLLDTHRILNAYPFQLSGGENQRCLLAIAIALAPKLLILDEPVVSLDSPFKNIFVRIIQKIQSEYGMAILIVTHNLSFIEGLADYIYIMHKGKIVEGGTFSDLVNQPAHHYTREIISYLTCLD